MRTIQTLFPGLSLVSPNPRRDAPFAVQWFKSDHGKETLLLMGNPEYKIGKPDLAVEITRINNFLKLADAGKQLTWAMRIDNKTIGAVWLELTDTEHLKSPAFHIMIGDSKYRGRGIGTIILQEMIRYAKQALKADTLYSRHLVSNHTIAHLNDKFGFVKDGVSYADEDGLEFQNVKLNLGSHSL